MFSSKGHFCKSHVEFDVGGKKIFYFLVKRDTYCRELTAAVSEPGVC